MDKLQKTSENHSQNQCKCHSQDPKDQIPTGREDSKLSRRIGSRLRENRVRDLEETVNLREILQKYSCPQAVNLKPLSHNIGPIKDDFLEIVKVFVNEVFLSLLSFCCYFLLF